MIAEIRRLNFSIASEEQVGVFALQLGQDLVGLLLVEHRRLLLNSLIWLDELLIHDVDVL